MSYILDPAPASPFPAVEVAEFYRLNGASNKVTDILLEQEIDGFTLAHMDEEALVRLGMTRAQAISVLKRRSDLDLPSPDAPNPPESRPR